MKTAFLLFFILLFLSTYAKAQQTFNSIKIKDLELPSETASKVLYLDGDKKVQSSTIGTAELEYLSGTTSAIQDQLDTNATAISTHESDTTTHGTTGAIVGTTDTQTLTNKTLTSPVINTPTGIIKGDIGLGNVDNTSDATKDAASATLTNKTITGASIQSPTRLDPKKDTLANLTSYAATASNGELVYSTDTKEFYTVTDGALVAAGGGVGGGDPGILSNGGFEEGSTDWTLAAGSSAADTSSFFEGDQSLAITLTAQTLSFKQSSTLNAAALTSLQGLGYIFAKAPSGTILSLCAISAGVTSDSLCHTQTANGTYYQLFKIPFTLSATSSGIELKSSAVVTGVVNVEKAWLGAVDLKQDVDQSRIAGESYFAGTTSCGWPRTSTTVGAFTATAACPGPTIVRSNMGTWATTDSNLPRQTITNLPAGQYKATFSSAYNVDVSNAVALAVTDGTTTCESSHVGASASQVPFTISCVFNYTSAGDRSFEIHAGSTGSTVNISNLYTSPRTSTKFILEYFGSGSVYSSTNADTDWASFTPTGQWTTNATYTGKWRRVKDEMEIQYNISTSGAPTGSSLTLNMPTGYTIDSSKLIATAGSTKKLGDGIANDAGIASYSIEALYNSTSAIDIFRSQSSSGTNPVNIQSSNYVSPTTPFTFGSGDSLNVTVKVPVSGWTQSNIIIGSFNGLESCTDSYECTDTFSANVDGTVSPSTVSNENLDFINGNCTRTATGVWDCPLKTGLAGNGNNLASKLNCVASRDSTITGGFNPIYDAATSTTSNIRFNMADGSNVAFNTKFTIKCQKGSSDYIGKTAKAVASDQNIATPGLTKVKACYYAFGGASATLASPTECTSGTCVEVIDSCGTGTPPTRSGSAGVYNDLTFASGTFANNTFVRCDCTSYDVTNAEIRQCTPYFATGDQTISSTASGSYVANIYSDNASGVNSDSYSIVTCEGQAP